MMHGRKNIKKRYNVGVSYNNTTFTLNFIQISQWFDRWWSNRHTHTHTQYVCLL